MRETPFPHEFPSHPWKLLGTDLFQFDWDNYLVIADNYSKFPLVTKMPIHCTAKAVADNTKKQFPEQRITQKVVSDNGPQFVAANTAHVQRGGHSSI